MDLQNLSNQTPHKVNLLLNSILIYVALTKSFTPVQRSCAQQTLAYGIDEIKASCYFHPYSSVVQISGYTLFVCINWMYVCSKCVCVLTRHIHQQFYDMSQHRFLAVWPLFCNKLLQNSSELSCKKFMSNQIKLEYFPIAGKVSC